MNITGKIKKLSPSGEFWSDVIQLDLDHFPRPWKQSEWETLDLAHNGLWVYLEQGRPIGLALFSTPQDETAHLLKILIIPERRGSEAAEEFWRLLAFELKEQGFLKVYLEVEESNERARAFYHKLGFELLRKVKSYYSDGEGAHMMQLTL